MPEPLVALPLEDLQRRTSAKWRTYPADVLPLWVAETDFPLADPIRRALSDAVALGDTGYASAGGGLREAYAGFAERRFGWDIGDAVLRPTGDVMFGVLEILRATIAPGDRVILTPPVYPPFFSVVAELGALVEPVPLLASADGWSLDLDGIAAALEAGARSILLCNPHNPTGTAHSRESLSQLATLAARYGAHVVSDEIHAPLSPTPGAVTPFLSVSDEARAVGFAVTSASKAFNLAGLKAAVMLAAGDVPARILTELPRSVESRLSHFGALASVAAFAPESDAWLDGLLAALGRNAALLGTLVADELPDARFVEPQAGFLGWVDVSAYPLGDDPAATILREAKVAFQHGPDFGAEGVGHVRVNFGCSPEVLTEAIRRVGALVRA